MEHISEARTNAAPVPWTPVLLNDAWGYWTDAWQRGVLFLDVLQQRSERYEEHAAKVAPHVLNSAAELVMDGRKLERPVNYVLVRIAPPAGVEIDAGERPFVSSTRARGMDLASAGSSRRARSASSSRQGIRAISSASCPILFPDRPSKTSCAPRPSSSSG